MSNAVDFHEKRNSRPTPIKVWDASEFQDKELPRRDWLIPGILVRGSITMLNGAGGVGKSLLCLQLQVASAIGAQWLGLDVPKMNSFGFYCEDDAEEIHRRLHDVCKHYGCTFADLDGRVRFASRVGEQNELMTFGYRNDKGIKTPVFDQIAEEFSSWGVQLGIIDTVADTYGGNENIRPQARAFINLVRRLALINMGGVLITAHPSRAGLADGSGLSGSTAWEGSVRCRVYFTKPKSPDKDVDGEDEPTDERVLKTMKSNYGPAGEKMRCKYDSGVFIRTDIVNGGSIINRLDDDRKILEAAEYLIRNGTYLAADFNAKNALVNLARKLPSCKLLSWKSAQASQDRLISNKRLEIVQAKRDGKWRTCIRPAHVRYPDEKGPGETDGASQAQSGLNLEGEG